MSDLIERQAAIDALERTKEKDPKGDIACFYNTITDNKIAVIEALPSASPKRCADCENLGKTQLLIPQPEQRWIPCSERLPEDFEEVNVTWINTDPEPYYDFAKGKPFTGTAVYYNGRWFWYSAVCTDYLREYGSSPNDLMDDSIKVVAWQPLPEPYKEGE